LGDITAAELTVRGRVQGVFFRASARETALSLGIAGWVRNLPDGSVEIYAEGDEPLVREMIEWCRRGPPLAAVAGVDVRWVAVRGLVGFKVTR
jgi:acylphosphatase